MALCVLKFGESKSWIEEGFRSLSVDVILRCKIVPILGYVVVVVVVLVVVWHQEKLP